MQALVTVNVKMYFCYKINKEGAGAKAPNEIL